MRFGQYQEVNVTVTSATFSRLKQGNPFNKRPVTHLTLKIHMVRWIEKIARSRQRRYLKQWSMQSSTDIGCWTHKEGWKERSV